MIYLHIYLKPFIDTLKPNNLNIQSSKPRLYAQKLEFWFISIVYVCVCVCSEGEEWQSVRSLLGKHMLRPKAVEAYDETLNSVVSDLIAKLHLRRRSGGLVTDIASEFYRFGLEGEISRRSGSGRVARHHAACDRMLALVMRSSVMQ